MEYYSSLDASQLDSETPTLFELISASQLESLLSPSLRYILVHYASKYPYFLLRIVNRFDELNLFFRTFIEWYFMKYWQGSFTENFYGLKRVTKTPISDPKYNSSKITQLAPSMIEERRKLSSLQRWVSVLEITGTSYLTEKFGYWYEIWYPKYITQQLEPLETDSELTKRKFAAQKFFVKWYPTVLSVLRAGDFITMLMYLAGQTKSPSLLMAFFKINYSRLNQYDYTKHKKNIKVKKNLPDPVVPVTTASHVLKYFSKNFAKPSWRILNYILGTFFPIAIFSLKFLEWYNNSNFSQKIAKNQGYVLDKLLPPPSSLLRKNREDSPASSKKPEYQAGKECPLCKQEITNPAIIETGYVFCYSCIYNYLFKSHLITSNKAGEASDVSDSDSEHTNSDHEQDAATKPASKKEKESRKLVVNEKVNIDLGGRCPVTGVRLLGCKWNSLKEEWQIEGIRRLIF